MGLGPEGLDGAMFINLERRMDRYWFALGGLTALEFPKDCITRFIAQDGQAYESTEGVHAAAVADGFDYFSEFRADTRNYAAWYWTYRRALRHIIETGQTLLVLIDDHLPKPGWTYRRLSYLVDYCEFRSGDHGDFRILQLCHSFYGHEQGFNQDPETGILSRGLAGGFDIGSIISPNGAKLLLEVSASEPLNSAPDSWYSRIYKQSDDPAYLSGMWHTLDEVCEHAFDYGDTDLPYEES